MCVARRQGRSTLGPVGQWNSSCVCKGVGLGCADFVLHYILLIHMINACFQGTGGWGHSALCRATRASWRLRSADWRGRNEREKKTGDLAPPVRRAWRTCPIMYRELEAKNGERRDRDAPGGSGAHWDCGGSSRTVLYWVNCALTRLRASAHRRCTAMYSRLVVGHHDA